MKKAYIIPLVEVVKTETEELICLSLIEDSYVDGENAGVFEKDDFGNAFENVFENLW